ncbi:MAG: hypothetical protein JXA42_11010 [Anaerolineales bacterium]|nr:hypothetical protein [Anaerolineales bacterium]
MDNLEITKFIIREFSRHRRPDDIIRTVCEKTGMPWYDAEEFIRQVRDEHQGEITGRQNRLLIGIAVLTVIIGVFLSIGILAATLDGWVIFFLQFPMPYLGNLMLFGLGIVIAAGGIVGIKNIKLR